MSRAHDPAIGVAYVRVSTDEQQLGPDAQRIAIARWAETQRVAIVAVHEDRLSGSTPVDQRPGLVAALESLRTHRAGLLVVAKRDRIARDVLVALQLQHMLAGMGRSRVASADGVATGDGPEAELFRLMLDGVAAFERRMIRARTQSALEVRRRRGDRYSGHAPLGRRHEAVAVPEGDPPRWRLTVDQAEAEAVARAVELRQRRLSYTAIARILTAEGRPCRGRRWHATSVSRMLRRAATG